MDRGAWQAIVHGVERVGHGLATKPPQVNWGTQSSTELSSAQLSSAVVLNSAGASAGTPGTIGFVA